MIELKYSKYTKLNDRHKLYYLTNEELNEL